MSQERCSDCGLTVEDVNIRGLIHDSEEEKFVKGLLSARFVCYRCGIDMKITVPVVRLINDMQIVCDPELLRSTLEEDETLSPKSELQAEKSKILLEYCPLRAGFRNSLPILD